MSDNGKLDVARELVPVSSTYLAPAAARAYGLMQAACHEATGVWIDIVNGSGGYRDLDAQRTLYLNPPRGVIVARPGLSTHGRGLALDLTTTCWTPAVARWCRDNCERFGFAVPPANDPRHFLLTKSTTTPASEGESAMATPDDILGHPINYNTGPEDSIALRVIRIREALDALIRKLGQPVVLQLSEEQENRLADKIAARIKTPTKGTITLT